MKLRKILGCILVGVAVLAAIAITLTIGWRPFIGAASRPLTDRKFEFTEARLERGKYLSEGLLGCMDQPALQRWVERGKDAGLLTALAGELKLEDIGLVSEAGPDVIGVRGAACDGGREGRVNASRVRALRDRADRNSGSVQGGSLSEWRTGWRNA